ncbi:MAG: DUF2318 domain-containing protein [Candidatus Omnitrophota bacterium]|nr:DUF2318 domain-containing protein [Candidatus Omnitrophota bacterium]MBU1928637.1 DUF2318 domain-containing protein [Candidatus Omnitrophota bacterium]MBU2034745.1 DUF2318 domain-containing protein [Candidatus Omnitrophota bacterium]MBU2222079.1 DUF2318 domain-containing protein [Candidatus Omnitrophota bacterium]MBU2258584.1 DUF2318 domain-containing protein [Candidatus Omnitrophota bacterium]
MNKSYLSIILLLILALTSAQNVSAFSADSQYFKGTKGEQVEPVDQEISLDVSSLDDGKAHYFNVLLPDGKTAYFFVLKSPDGVYRAAFNACQVCGGALQGFRQVGDYMVCNTCGNRYPLDRIATEKGGCNPIPINPDLKVSGGKISIRLSDLEKG